MDGKWVETKTRKMIYGTIAPKVEHPTLTKKASVKPCFKSDMVHMMLELKYALPLLPNLETYHLLHRFQICLRVRVALLNTKRSYHWEAIFSNVGCWRFGVERIPSLQHSMLLHLVRSTKRIWSNKVQNRLFGTLCLKYCQLKYVYQ
jgi:hypothetical protein